MSVHIGAEKKQIAKKVLLPGDPLRAKFIAENFMTDVEQYNTVRNMFGFTGLYKGERISAQGSGMGIPSAMIYAHELYTEYDVNQIIRVGSAGAMKLDVHVRDLVIAQGATTDSNILNQIFNHQVSYSPIASFNLLDKAYHIANERGFKTHVGNVLSADRFYNQELDKEKLANYGILAVEMEAAGLYTLAAQHNKEALAIMTISDHLLTGEETTAEERQNTFNEMIELALDVFA
ncbi:purine-nucleoside phosphorylase [Atopobacter phocae]|uniref:purine-nucleoside phosphorylase n=1 Tax=Atopobacter phocae TaxID=136492 RepID=UPI00046F9FD3|nr:purine-nucleoside phosphorylase [Atopobacter phocae]